MDHQPSDEATLIGKHLKEILEVKKVETLCSVEKFSNLFHTSECFPVPFILFDGLKLYALTPSDS